MYTVKVFVDSREYPEAVDSRDFEFGTWNEIGLWLDHYGYNDPKYHVLINFVNVS